MPEANVVSRTQRIVSDPLTSSVEVVSAGPIGPAGPTGEVSISYLNTELSNVVRDADLAPVLADIADLQVDVTATENALREVDPTVVHLPAGSTIRLPKTVDTAVTGDITFEFDVAMNDWSRADNAFQPIAARDFNGRSWVIYLYNSGMYITTSPDGSTANQVNYVFVGYHNTLADKARGRFAVTIDVNNGSGNSVGRLWERDNWDDSAPTWVLRGTHSSNPTTSIYGTAIPIHINTMQNMLSFGFGMKVRSFRLASGIGVGGLPGGVTVTEWNARLHQNPYVDVSGKTWELYGDWEWSTFNGGYYGSDNGLSERVTQEELSETQERLQKHLEPINTAYFPIANGKVASFANETTSNTELMGGSHFTFTGEPSSQIDAAISVPTDADADWRVDVLRPENPPADPYKQYRPTEAPFIIIFAPDNISANVYTQDGTFPLAYAYYRDLGDEFPDVGERLQVRATWNKTTDQITLYWRAEGNLESDSGWIQAGTIGNAPGKQLSSEITSWAIGGLQPNLSFKGTLFRALVKVNGIINADVDASVSYAHNMGSIAPNKWSPPTQYPISTGTVQTGIRNLEGDGSPEGIIAAPIGWRYTNRLAAPGDPIAWIKRVGTGNTGWWVEGAPERVVVGMQDLDVAYGPAVQAILPAMPGWALPPDSDAYLAAYLGDLLGWKTCKVEILWSAQTANAGNIYLFFEAWRLQHNSVVTYIAGQATTDSAPLLSNAYKYTTVPNMDLSGVTTDKVISFRVSRSGSVAADTYPDYIYLHSIVLTRLA